MSESPQTPPSSRKKKLLIAAIGAAAVCVLTAGTVVGINTSNGKTEQLCTEASTASQDATKAVKTSVEKAAKARTQADAVEGYAKREGAAALLKNVDTAKTDLNKIKLGGDCESREDAEAIKDNSGTAKSQVTKLDAATKKLTADVTAFQAEAKRVADEKAAADAAAKAEESKKAEEAKAAEAAAAEQAAADQAAADQAAAAPGPAPAPAAQPQPQYAGGGTSYVAPQAPKYNAPAPAPYVPAPAPAPYVPAPAPVTGGGGGGWTPPPAGSGGGSGCINIGGVKGCGVG